MIFCTVADKNYIHKALVMIRSLNMHHPGAQVLWLCLDDESFMAANKMRQADYIPSLFPPQHISTLLSNYPELKALKENIRPSQYGDAYSQWCWSLAPFFLWHIRTQTFLAGEDPVFYIDADIWFTTVKHKSLFDHIIEYSKEHNKGIFIHSHRNVDPGKYDPKDTSGYYNVGVIGFDIKHSGTEALEWWKNVMLNPENQWAKEYGSCGDQKYLDLLPKLFNPDHILEFDTALKMNHGAPWNVRRHIYHPTGDVQYMPQGGSFLPSPGFDFYHFSHFTHNFENKTWRSNFKGEWDPENAHPYVKELYEAYFRELFFIDRALKKHEILR